MTFAEELFAAMSECEFDAKELGQFLAGFPRLFFIGNGGSAAIASHMANDFTVNALIPSLAFNDAAALTCLANDFGYEHAFASQIDSHVTEDDCVIAISSSGRSRNIIVGAQMAIDCEAALVTFTGFAHDNPLRDMGAKNYHVKSKDYGIVETAHLGMLHDTIREIKLARR